MGRGDEHCPLWAAVQAARVGLWDWDVRSDRVAYSAGWKRQLGYSDAEIGDGYVEWESRVHPDDLPRVQAQLADFLAGRATEYRTEFRMRHKDGGWRWILAEADLIRGEGRPVRLVGSHVDITDQKRVVRELSRTNRALRMLSESNQTLIRATDELSLLRRVCDVAVDVGGYRMAWVGFDEAGQVRPVAYAGFDEGYLAERTARPSPLASAALATGEPAIAHDISRDDSFRPYRVAARTRGFRSAIALPLVAGGAPFGVLKMYSGEIDAFDADEVAILLELAGDLAYGITALRIRAERDRATESLRTAVRQLQTLTDGIPDFLSRFDTEGRFVLVNAALQRSAGVSPDAVLGRTPLEVGPCADPAQNVALQESITRVVREGTPDRLEVDFLTLAGAHRFEVRHIPEKDEDGAVVSVLGIARDLSDVLQRRQLEDQLRQSQKMEAIGQLAGGIAHDFNNMLAIVQLRATLLLGRAAPDPEVQAGLRDIVGAAERAGNLTRQLLTFSRMQVAEPVDMDIAEGIGNMLVLLRRVLGEDIVLETQFSPSLPHIRADPAMMEQVLMNLAINARDAMPDGGRLSVSLHVADVSEQRAATHPGVTPGRHVCLSVSDTGAGIPADLLPRIFEPFFTTKEQGKGTGLGLATVFGIVRQHHGFIEVESAVGRGSTFRVFLPAKAQPPTEETSGREPSRVTRGGEEMILLVEDEASVRSATRLALERYGYRVIEADSAAEAIARFEASELPVDLLLTDLVIPGGVTGRQLADQLLARQPRLAVLYASGYSREVVARQLHDDQRCTLIQKPYTTEALAGAVRRCLDARR